MTATLSDFGFETLRIQNTCPAQDIAIQSTETLTIKKASPKKREETPKIIKAESDYQPELGAWIKKCQEKKESYLYWAFDYYSMIELDNKIEFISAERVLERLNRGRNDSYGGSWGSGGWYQAPDGLKKLWEELLSMKKGWLSKPYHREKADEFSIRGIRKENIRVFISRKAKEFLKEKGGWDFDLFQDKWDNVPEAELSPEIARKNDRYYELHKLIDDLDKNIWPRKRELEDAISRTIQGSQTRLINPAADLCEKIKEYMEWRAQCQAFSNERDSLAKEFRGGH